MVVQGQLAIVEPAVRLNDLYEVTYMKSENNVTDTRNFFFLFFFCGGGGGGGGGGGEEWLERDDFFFSDKETKFEKKKKNQWMFFFWPKKTKKKHKKTRGPWGPELLTWVYRPKVKHHLNIPNGLKFLKYEGQWLKVKE